MKYIEVRLNKEITWPSSCAICNQAASVYAYTNYRIIDGFYLVAIRETIHRARYPVCNKHKWTARFYSFVTNQAFATGFVMALTFPLLLSIPILFLDVLNPKLVDSAVIAVYGGFTFGIFYWKFRNPVKVIKVKKDRRIQV